MELLSNVDDVNITTYLNSSLVDIVTKQIRANIYNGKYQPGKKLIVRELAEELEVSHTPIKDALNRLVAEGYVEALPRKSMIVKKYNTSEFIELLEIRLMYEVHCVEEVIEKARVDTHLVEELKTIERQIRSLSEKTHLAEKEKWFGLDATFHAAYMRATDNQAILAQYSGLQTQRFSYFAVLQSSNKILDTARFESDRKAHARIIGAIELKDAALLRRAIIEHIVTVGSDHELDERDRKRVERMARL